MKLIVINLGFIVSALVISAGSAHAQSATDLENAVTTGSQFDEAQILLDKQRDEAEDGSIIDGEPGIFILRKNKIFNYGGAISTGYSDNPGRTLNTEGEEAYYTSAALSAGINTRVAQQYDTGVNVVGSLNKYDRDDAPSNSNVIVNSYVGVPVFDGALYVSANAAAGLNMDDDFDHGTAFYQIGANASNITKLSETILLRPSIAVARQWSGQGEQKNVSATASAELIWRASPKWLVRGNIAYTHRIYDDFFEDVTFVEREDDLIRWGLSVSRQITETVYAAISFEYADQSSSFFISEYDALDGGLSLRVSRRF